MTTETLPEILPDIEAPAPRVVPDEGTRQKTAYLPLYKVIMWDDNVTTTEFVIRMLVKVFVKDYHTAEKLMLEVHLTGATLTYDIDFLVPVKAHLCGGRLFEEKEVDIISQSFPGKAPDISLGNKRGVFSLGVDESGSFKRSGNFGENGIESAQQKYK